MRDHNLYSFLVPAAAGRRRPYYYNSSVNLANCVLQYYLIYNIQNQELYQRMHNQRNDDENKDIGFSFFPNFVLVFVR